MRERRTKSNNDSGGQDISERRKGEKMKWEREREGKEGEGRDTELEGEGRREKEWKRTGGSEKRKE